MRINWKNMCYLLTGCSVIFLVCTAFCLPTYVNFAGAVVWGFESGALLGPVFIFD